MLNYKGKIINLLFLSMHNWIALLTTLLWLTILAFVFNTSNFIYLFIYSEVSWVVLYCLSILLGVVSDDLNLFTLSFLLLGFASIEFVSGFLLIIVFKKFNLNLNFHNTEVRFYSFLYNNSKKLNISKINWN